MIHEAGLDFNLVQIGDSSMCYITLENICSLPLEWKLKCLDDANKDCFEFQSNGKLSSLETKRIQIIFTPNKEIILNSLFDLEIENGNTMFVKLQLLYFSKLKFNLIFQKKINRTINCHGQAQYPKACLLESEINLSDLYLEIAQRVNVKLYNNSALRASFKWDIANLPQTILDCAEIYFEEPTGYLEGRQVLDCFFIVKPLKLGTISQSVIKCYIEDQSDPVVLAISGFVKGLTLYYYSSNLDEIE
jgi:hypothetical protein